MKVDGGEDLLSIAKSELGEGVFPSEVNKAVEMLGNRYPIAKELLDKAKRAEVIKVDSSEFLMVTEAYFTKLGYRQIEETEDLDSNDEKGKAVAEAMGVDWGEMVARRKEELKTLRGKLSSDVGLCLPSEEGSRIYLNREKMIGRDTNEVLAHELLHFMMDSADGSSGFQQVDGRYRDLNEATVQLMVLGINYPDLKFGEMRKEIDEGKIKTAYGKQISALLVLLEATSCGNNPLTINDIAGLYFDREIDNGFRPILFKMEIARRIPEKLGEMPNFRANNLALFESSFEKRGL